MDTCIDIKIVDLSDLPDAISLVAAWHHEEWVRGLPKKVHDEQAKLGTIGLDVQEREQSLRAHTGSDTLPSTFVAHRAGLPIGSVSLVNYYFTLGQQPSQWLTNLYVIKQYRQQGLGTRLIDRAVAFAAEQHIAELFLYTRNLERFYTKRNWVFSREGVVQGNRVSVLKRNIRG